MKRRQRGFTVIEILIVAAIGMLSLAIAFPSIQQARQRSRDAKCVNNLKQIGLAMHNYHDVYLGFPPGWIARGGHPAGHITNGWGTATLPFMDQAPLYNQLDTISFAVTFPNGQPNLRMQSLLKTPLSVFKCPAEPKVDVNVLRGGWGTTNYTVNFGASPIPRWSGQEFAGQVPTPIGRAAARQVSGIAWANSFVKIRDITDGTSNTFLAGERSVIGRSGLWFGVRSNYQESDTVSDASWASGLNMSDTGFSSRHPDGVHFVLCDGSVRFLSEQIASSPQGGLLQNLAGRNDGNVVGEF